MTQTVWFSAAIFTCCLGCGANLSDGQAKSLRSELRAAMHAQVSTREQRDANSRKLADVVGRGVVEGLTQPEVRAAFGPGRACRLPLCAEQGFSEADWYYEIGQLPDDEQARKKVKQLPVLIIAFEPRGRAAHVWTLTTHD